MRSHPTTSIEPCRVENEEEAKLEGEGQDFIAQLFGECQALLRNLLRPLDVSERVRERDAESVAQARERPLVAAAFGDRTRLLEQLVRFRLRDAEPPAVLEHHDPSQQAELLSELGILDRLALTLRRVHLQRRLAGVRDAQEVEGERQLSFESTIEQQQPAGDLLARDLVCVVLGDAVEVSQQLQDGKHRNQLAVSGTVRLEDGDLARTTALQEFQAETALADASVCHDTDDPALPFDRALQ